MSEEVVGERYRNVAWLRFELEDADNKLIWLRREGLEDHSVAHSLREYRRNVELLRTYAIRAEQAERDQQAAVERVLAAQEAAWQRTKRRFKLVLVAFGVLAAVVGVMVVMG